MMEFDLDSITNFFSIKTVVGILFFVLWIGYLIYCITIVGKVRVLSQTLKTSLSGINQMSAWIHLGVVVFIGLIAMILIIF